MLNTVSMDTVGTEAKVIKACRIELTNYESTSILYALA